MNTIGFIPAKKKEKPRSERDDLILRFDSGKGISCAEGCHNTAILGSTGCGKTTSGILPVASALLEAGFGGLILDVKGNLTDHIRRLAERSGRADDVVEFGSGPCAVPVNLLAHMDMTAIHDFFKTLATREFASQSSNMDWHLKGVRIAADCVEALRYGHEKFPAIPMDIGAVESLLNDYALAAKLFKVLKDFVLDPTNKQHARFISMIEQEQFHVLSFDPKKISGSNSSYAEQTTWRLNAIRNGLDAFRKAPGILRNFSASGGEAIDLKRLVYDEKRVVVLRFDVGTGMIGASLARHVLERFYQMTYVNGLSLSPVEHTFMIADEAQEIVDLSPYNKMNDNAFAAKAREFRVIQVIATQSVAALASRGASHTATSEYMNNFNNRITMYCDDPLTQDMTMRHLPDVSLTRLGPGKCVVTRFDMETRRHTASVESLQQEHDTILEVLHQPESQQETTMKQAFVELDAEPAAPDLSEILSAVGAEVGQARAASKKEEKAKGESRPKRSYFDKGADGEWRRSAPGSMEDVSASGPVTLDDLNPGLRAVIERHRQFFRSVRAKGADSPLHVPAGWLPALDRALEAMEHVQVDLDIQGFSLCSGALTIPEFSRHSGTLLGEKLLNKLLTVTCEVCPICGKRVTPPKDEGEDRQGFCEGCLSTYDLMPSRRISRRGATNEAGEADPFDLVGM